MIGKTSSDVEAQRAAVPGRCKVALALQGGGSHGAFTWGVLDRLLEDATIEIIGVTGTSAGAMNGAARSWRNFQCRANLTTTRLCWSTCSI
jgi:predicted acylesterase/phospholipase RssA